MAYRVMVLGCLLLEACAGGRLVALADPASQVDRGRQAITRRVSGLTVTVAAAAWSHRPRSLPEKVLPFLIEVVNEGRTPATLRLAEARLLDDLGRTSPALRADDVIALLVGGADAVQILPSIGFEVMAPEPTIFGLELGLQFDLQRDLEPIRSLAFPVAPILRGSRASGFVYFRRPRPDARRLTLLLPLDADGTRDELAFSYAIDG